MARYLNIFAQQQPFTISETDESNRVVWVVNFSCAVQSLTIVESDIVAFLLSNAVGTPGTNIFVGPAPILPPPETTDPIILVSNYNGGRGLDRAMDGVIHNASFQISVRSRNYLTGRQKIDQIFSLLDGRANVDIP